MVTVLLGYDMPIVLREREPGEPLRLIDEAYMHGWMDGWALKGVTLEIVRNALDASG